MKKVLFVATVVKTHIMEFHIPYLKMFKELGWETAVAAKNDYENPEDCVIPSCDTYYNVPFERNPLKLNNLNSYKMLKKIIDEGNYDIIHCHTPVGAMLTRLAALDARKHGTKVIYTAHGFHFYKGAPFINWLLYYPVEKLLSSFTDVLITINKEDYERAKTFKAKEVFYVPGVGIDLRKFNSGYVDKTVKRNEIGISADDFVLLSVGNLIPLENHEIVFRAMSVLKNDNKLDNIKYVICGLNENEDKLKKMAEELCISDYICFLGNRSDIAEIFNCSDLFMFMTMEDQDSIELMEAMASGLPSICLNNYSESDLFENEKTGLAVNKNPEKVAKAIISMRDNKDLCKKIGSVAVHKIKHYCLDDIKDRISQIDSTNSKFASLLGICKGQSIRKQLGIPLDAKVILSVGEVNKNKNHKTGIEALAKLNDPNTYYVICGRGPLVDSHKELAKNLGVGNRVILTGYRTDVADLYKMADVFLFPSFREGLPVAVMEAMASRLPVIGTKIRGSSDLLNQENLFDPTDVDGIANAIENIELGCINHDIDNFAIQSVLNKVKDIYKI